MKSYLRLLLPAGLMLLLLGTIAAACASDDELTLEEFFEQGQAIDADFEVQIEEAYDSFEFDGEETDENLQAEKDSYGEFAAAYDEFFDELGTLNPPSEAEDEFDDLLKAGRDIVEFLEEYAVRIEGAESSSEIAQLLDEGDAESEALREPYQDACQSLQDIADANDIVAEIECANEF